jgi:hypothetical protein
MPRPPSPASPPCGPSSSLRTSPSRSSLRPSRPPPRPSSPPASPRLSPRSCHASSAQAPASRPTTTPSSSAPTTSSSTAPVKRSSLAREVTHRPCVRAATAILHRQVFPPPQGRLLIDHRLLPRTGPASTSVSSASTPVRARCAAASTPPRPVPPTVSYRASVLCCIPAPS